MLTVSGPGKAVTRANCLSQQVGEGRFAAQQKVYRAGGMDMGEPNAKEGEAQRLKDFRAEAVLELGLEG